MRTPDICSRSVRQNFITTPYGVRYPFKDTNRRNIKEDQGRGTSNKVNNAGGRCNFCSSGAEIRYEAEAPPSSWFET